VAETGKDVRQIEFHVTRFNPETDRAPYIKTYTVPVREGMTVLDGLHYIKDNLDPTLAWRYSCRMGICGSCGMLLNGRPALACNTQILHTADGNLTVGPLPNFEIIRDLVPDLFAMFDKHRFVKPHIVRKDEAEINDPAGEFYQSPEQLENYLQFTYCIKCGCCMGACPTLATDARYLGPMPLTAAQRYNADTRDEGRDERNAATGEAAGVFRCHYAGECSRACPKGVDPGRALQLLKRRLVLDYLHLARHRTPCQKLHGPGEGKPLANLAPAPKRTVGDHQ
jgi:succinate dehydrogenase / fumarate reductase iron-sulfur subunit